MRDIDLVTLRLFAAAIEEGTLSRSAERENIALSAISRRISDLEARCGVTLLERHDRGVTPTAAGEMLFSRIRTLVVLLEQTIIDMESIRGGAHGHIRLHAHMSATSGMLPEKIALFLDAHPGIDIELNEFTSLEVLHAVRTGTADLGLVSGTVHSEDLHFLPWLHDELVALLPGGHRLLAMSKLQLSDMLNEPFVGMQRDSALLTLYRQQAAVLGRTLRERAHATSFESVRAMVKAGLGVSILPATAAFPFVVDGSNLAVRTLDEPWARRPLMLCIRDPEKLSSATRMLVNHLANWVASAEPDARIKFLLGL